MAALVVENTAFEKHYRISDLARLWGLGRETVRKLVKDDPGVVKVRMGRKMAHTIYTVPESAAQRIQTRLLNAASTSFGFGLSSKASLNNLRQACLSLRNPPCVMLPHRVFVVAQEVRNIGYRHAALEEDTRESVAETVRRRRLLEFPCKVEDLTYSPPPHICYRFETV